MQAAKRLRRELTLHCGGTPSATQAAIIEQAAEIKLRLVVMDEDFRRTGRRSAHASRDYLSWSANLVRTVARLGLKGATSADKPARLTDYLAARAATKPDATEAAAA
jgi:hypothetical protein